MKRIVALLAALSILCSLTACTQAPESADLETNTVEPAPAAPEDNKAAENQTSDTLLDYIDVLDDPDAYVGQKIKVAGRISDFDFGGKAVFKERTKSSLSSFAVDILPDQYQKKAKDVYAVNDCILVSGEWTSSYYLRNASVINSGNQAQEIVQEQTQQWRLKNESIASTLPLTDYMEITENPDKYNKTRVRVAGQISNMSDYFSTFSFLERQTGESALNISFSGFPLEMKAQCADGEYVIISGVVTGVGVPFQGTLDLNDCFLESVGDAAKEASENTTADWVKAYNEKRKAFIQTCETYSYEELARRPEDYKGKNIKISGSVLQVDGDTILVDAGDIDIIYVSYVGKQKSDPKILENDKIEFYGTYSGTITYVTVLGSNKTVPYVYALYSSANQ
ncbi:hypothetical protein [Intestinibacillus massiliensis]|uniref:hypothetical protein n=1 Tax=Intestinibacillus massiliensis TaxID=1871029 RepID=UPI000B35851F|nr:hypothetical protein [Intestinibacillus massiliensis]